MAKAAEPRLPPGPSLDILIEDEGWRAVPEVEALVERAVAAAADGSGLTLRAGAEISVLLTGDGPQQALNRQWRGVDKPTNVLSFPAATPDALAQAPMLGDVAVAWGVTSREAADEGKSVADHLTHLVVHGVLHLLGLDHGTDEEAGAMEALETRILAGLGVAAPYDDRT